MTDFVTMSPLHCFQLYLFIVCVHLFTIFSYFIYYSDRLLFSEEIEEKYDYIIVGSGTAGALIASRLAAETEFTSIVLEAGCHSHFLLEIPVLGPFLHRSVFDWQFESVPQENACLAMEGRICRLPQGKIVGGSSKLNNMIHIRGNISHYVEWFHGKHTKEYITKQFQYIEEELLHINDMQYDSEFSNAILKGAEEIGFQKNLKDFGVGFMKNKLSQRNGKRWTTSDNLLPKQVVTNAMVENVIFNGNTAVGVNVNVKGKKHKIYAGKGVILSAGALNSPKILQLSGIGPEHVLKPLNIPVIKVLPVGKNLQDHVAIGLDLVHFNRKVSIDAFDMINPINAINYFLSGKGPLTTAGCEAVGFISTKNLTTPDLQYMVMPVGLASDRGSLCSKSLGVKHLVWDNYFAKSFDKYVATVLSVLLHPKSKGEVYIKSKYPLQSPVFDPKYLSAGEDIKVLVEGLKTVKKLVESDALKEIGGSLNPHHFPACESYDFFSDAYLECYVRQFTLTSYHPVGTCSMGLPDAKNTVVDTSFKVLGVEKLFVADASVLPALPSANINAAVAMMASIFFDTNIIMKTKIKPTYCKHEDIFYVHELCFK